MQTNQTGERKKKPFLWILAIVALLLIGAMGIFSRYMWMHPPQVRTPVVVRGKIPAPPPLPAVESEPPAGDDSPESASDVRNRDDLPSTQSESVEAAPQGSVSGRNAEIAAAPNGAATVDPRSEKADDAEQTGTSGSTDDQASVPGDGDDRPVATAVDELPAAAQDSPEIKPSPDGAPPAPPAARTEPAAAPESPMITETPAPYAIQVGAYRAKGNADRQIGRLQEKGFDAYLYEKIDRDQRAWYFVRFGRFESYHAAAQALKEFKTQEQADGAIVRSKN